MGLFDSKSHLISSFRGPSSSISKVWAPEYLRILCLLANLRGAQCDLTCHTFCEALKTRNLQLYSFPNRDHGNVISFNIIFVSILKELVFYITSLAKCIVPKEFCIFYKIHTIRGHIPSNDRIFECHPQASKMVLSRM